MWVQEEPLEDGMAIQSSIFAWRTPWTEEPGRMWSTGSQRVEHNRSDLADTQATTTRLGGTYEDN